MYVLIYYFTGLNYTTRQFLLLYYALCFLYSPLSFKLLLPPFNPSRKSASWITSLQTFLGNALGRVEELEKKVKEEGEAADKARADRRRLRVELN